jgi:uncharacterized DUF497 family protein
MNEINEKFSWDPEKRDLNIRERGLDMVWFAPKIFADPKLVIELDSREDYSEKRYLAYGLVEGLRLCLCYTPREGMIHLITIFKMHKKEWEKHYGKNS